MSWDAVILAEAHPGGSLLPHVQALFQQQRTSWEALRAGEAALATVCTRRLNDAGSEVVVQSNPGRRRSTHAAVDAASVAQRPCFLCPQNLPAAERGIAYGDLVLLANPYPVLPWHCTVASREHQPQRLRDRLGQLASLARAAGPDLVVFYNGPQCGASAPDHFHLQACGAAEVPLLAEVRRMSPGRAAHQTFGRSVLVAAEEEPAAIVQFVGQVLDAMARQEASSGRSSVPEPMLNVLVLFRDPDFVCVVVPRSAHRPACYFESGPGRLAISPATLEMAGLLVVAEPEHFHRVDVGLARAIYEEVSLPPDRFAALADAVLT